MAKIAAVIGILALASVAWADPIPQAVIDTENQLSAIGNNAELLAAAQEITRLREVNAALQKQLEIAQKADPPTPATPIPTPPAITGAPVESPAWRPSALPPPPSASPTPVTK